MFEIQGDDLNILVLILDLSYEVLSSVCCITW